MDWTVRLRYEFKIHGPIKGGKNRVQITRSGRRYPLKKWAEWRDRVVSGIREVCNPASRGMITKPCILSVIYIPSDLKRRDTPAMLDSIYHCLEKSGIVADDFLIQRVMWDQLERDKTRAGASIILEEI